MDWASKQIIQLTGDSSKKKKIKRRMWSSHLEGQVERDRYLSDDFSLPLQSTGTETILRCWVWYIKKDERVFPGGIYKEHLHFKT